MVNEIRTMLFALQDREFGDFSARLMPDQDRETVIGVRTPDLRKLAGTLVKREGIQTFLEDLPHQYFEENLLHAFLISREKDFDTCIEKLERFLPYVNNWAVCDQMSPTVFAKNREALLPYIRNWLGSDHTYTVRFAIGVLMSHFLDEAFDKGYLDLVAAVRSDEYYINMMIAWYFATALAKQWQEALPYIETNRLEEWTHNKTIQKAVESNRILPEQKAYLKTLKVNRSKKKTEAATTAPAKKGIGNKDR